MKEYIIKKSRQGHLCSVPGCLSRETRAIARANGDHGSIHLCDECIAAAAAAAGLPAKKKAVRQNESKDK
ncbi:MAG: hypothetical protein IJR89_03165 [Clostridia bacterium]|nr:hypothetical protein [Clostridia bacterium]